jgi:uncharacterized tellurite resistance protein B-like protein
MSILRLLGLDGEPKEGVRPLQDALTALGSSRATCIAAFTDILVRVAAADGVFSAEEVREILRILKDEGSLTEPNRRLLLEAALRRERDDEITDAVVAAEFGRLADRDQKSALLNGLFAVAAAEGDISPEEEDTIKRIAAEMQIPDRDFVAVRYRYLKHLRGFRAKATWR